MISATLEGGFLGGAIVGLAEVTLIFSTSAGAEEYWLITYAIVAYGLLGAVMGVIAAGALLITRRAAAASGFSLATGLAVGSLACVIARYHVIQRIFHEELVTVSAMGVAVHLGLLVGGVVVGWICARTLRVVYERVAPVGVLAIVAVMLVGSIGAALAIAHPESGTVSAAAKATATGPNIIMIVTDTLRADALTAYGGKPGQSPALDAFARDGVLFERAYSQSSWTRPSIASLLTSLYPSVHGAVHKMDMLPDRVVTIAEALGDAGYWTAGIVSNINVAPIFGFSQGFGEYHYLPPDFYFWATDSSTRLAIYKGIRSARERLGARVKYYYNYYQDAKVVSTTAERWLERQPPHPFFLLIHFMEPHDPYFTHPYNGHGIARASEPDPAPGRRDELHGLYLQNVSYLDEFLGHLFGRLRALGLYDDTVIAVVADHGEEFQEHGGWWHGTTLYEEAVHVPLMIKRAHEPAPGTRRHDFVRTIDVAPTLLHAAGQHVPDAFMGRDVFDGDTSEHPLIAEEDLEGNVLASIRIGDWKLVSANAGNPRGLRPIELYDLSVDPHETNNRAAAEAERGTTLLNELARARAQIAARRRTASGENGAADHRS